MPDTEVEPILELSTLAPQRPTVLIRSNLHPEGRHYELTVAADLSIQTQADLGKYGETMAALEGKEMPSPADAKRLSEVINKLVVAVLPDLEPEVVEELKDAAKLEIVRAFTQASPLPEAAEAAAT